MARWESAAWEIDGNWLTGTFCIQNVSTFVLVYESLASQSFHGVYRFLQRSTIKIHYIHRSWKSVIFYYMHTFKRRCFFFFLLQWLMLGRSMLAMYFLYYSFFPSFCPYFRSKSLFLPLSAISPAFFLNSEVLSCHLYWPRNFCLLPCHLLSITLSWLTASLFIVTSDVLLCFSSSLCSCWGYWP